ncbi:spore coat CotO family protein [Cytobacillus firmus]|uniref:CotO family spore coat protein n=1 Tax=Cytobacillus firmus TaxID=1399 RepID=UPI001CFCD0BC|nr:CotO family spore coat protein [Cytobacillus firmus]USK40308.1 spore coat CotO family protein [Cytobacillus firmus]WHY63141.1 CotO family spore coat protein [Cytobacillus firmus]
MTEKREKEPLFYIQQPNFQIPENRMQTIYSSRKAEKERKQNENLLDFAVPKEVQKEPEEKIEKTAGQMEVQEAIEEFESGREEKKGASFAFTTEKRKPSFNRVKSFKEMDTLERLDYLIDFPKQLPPIPCTFETGEKAIRGFLVSKNEEWIEVKLFDERIEKINLQSLNAIKMIGLRR